MPQVLVAVLLSVPTIFGILLARRAWLAGRRTSFYLSLVIFVPVTLFEADLSVSAALVERGWDGVDDVRRVSATEMIGVWQSDDQKVEFKSDGTVADSNGSQGSWEIQRGQFVARGRQVANGEFATWVVLRRRGVLSIARVVGEDPDNWYLRRFFVKAPARGS